MLHGISQVKSSAMSKRLRREISSCHLSTSALSLLYLVVMLTVCANTLPPCSLELFDSVEVMLKYINEKKSSIEERLYTPNETDYENCPKSTLTCFAEEVKVLFYHIPASRVSLLNRRLMSINTMEDHRSCLQFQCELKNMESAVTFQQTLKYILQKFCDHGY